MKTLLEIQAAIENLPRQEFWKLAKWFDQRKEDIWDQEMEEDARPGGPLDKLFEEAMAEVKAGLTVPLEEVLRQKPRKLPRGRQPPRSKS
jgi:hypothetical protein